MAITYSFVDNQIYGADDINKITKDLTGAGVAPFISNESYNLADLNVLTETLVASGVNLGGCKCTISEGTVTVAQGIIFFESGLHLTVDEDGYSLTVPEGTAGYILAHHHLLDGKAGIKFSEEPPQNEEYVLLAKILENGTIKDIRCFAEAKIATMGKNLTQTATFTEYKENFIPDWSSESSTITENQTRLYCHLKTEVPDLSKFNYAFFNYSLEKGLFDIRKNSFFFIRDILYENQRNNTIITIQGVPHLLFVKDGQLVIGTFSNICGLDPSQVELILM